MATGALDANGIWQYGEDDAYATHSQLLNKVAQSTSDTVTRLESMSGISAAQKTTAQDNLGIGLVHIIPASVNVTAGSATANSVGEVTFSGATSVSLNSVFTSACRSYRIIINLGAASSSGRFGIRLRASNTDLATNSYDSQFANFSGGSLLASQLTAQSYFTNGQVDAQTTERSFAAFDISNPATSMNTTLHGTFGGFVGGFATGNVNNTSAYDGFTIVHASGIALTGKVQVFGYNN